MASGGEFLDIRTLILSIMIIEVFLSIIMILYWKRRGGYPGFAIWAVHLVFLVIAQANTIFRDTIPPLISIPATNFFNAFAMLLVYEAANRFYTGRPVDWRWYLVLPLVLTGALIGTVVIDSLTLRTVMISIVVLVLSFQTARVFYRNITGDENIISWLLTACYSSLVILFLLRIIDFWLHPAGRTLFEQTTTNSLLYLTILFASIGATLLFIILNFDRVTRDRDKTAMEKERLAHRYELAIETAGAGVWEIDQATLKVHGDEQIFRMTGREYYGGGEYLSLEEVVHPDDLPRLVREIKAVSQENANFISEYRIRKADGEIRYHVSHARSLPAGDGTGLHLVGLSTDITPLRQAQNVLKETMKKLSILSSITRHDILNCATVIGLTTEILIEESREEKVLNRLKNIADTGKEITRLIRFTGEYQDLGMHEPLWVDIVQVLSRESIRTMLAGRNLHLPRQGIRLYVDQMIEKVLYNLVENSIRHGEDVKNLTISYEYQGKDLLVIYADDGRGIPDEEKEMIFNRGYGKNTGMGLFLIREILAITGITIKENGISGRGARFEIRVKPGSYQDRRELPD